MYRGWLLFVLVPIGLTLSLMAILLARRFDSRAKKIGARVVNGCTLVLRLLILTGLGWMFLSTTWVTDIVPKNYMGDVFVLHNVADGSFPESSFWGMTYHIRKRNLPQSVSHVSRLVTGDLLSRTS